MTVGLVIVTYNAAAFVRRCLEAVAAQTVRPQRVVVIDNGSSDDTAAVIQQAAVELALAIELVALGRNSGFPTANNLGVARLADCDGVALLNPDAFPEPRWLASLVAAAAAHPEAGSFASRLMLADRVDVLDGAGDAYHRSGLVWRHGHGQPLTSVPEALVSGPVFAPCAAAALYRREDWLRAGGLDERYFCYVEDVDLGFRLQLLNRGCFYAADAVVHHMGSATTGVGSHFSVFHGHRNLEWTFVKNLPASLLLRYLPLHLATSLAAVAWFALRGRGGSILRAKWSALVGLGPVLAERRHIQAHRLATTGQIAALMDHTSLGDRFRRRLNRASDVGTQT